MRLTFTNQFSMSRRMTLTGGPEQGLIRGHFAEVRVVCTPKTDFLKGSNTSPFMDTARNAWDTWVSCLNNSLHCTVSDPLVTFFQNEQPNKLNHIVTTPGDPTAEMLTLLMARKFKALCSNLLQLNSITFSLDALEAMTLDFPVDDIESPEIKDFILAPSNVANWWDKNDMSVNIFGIQ